MFFCIFLHHNSFSIYQRIVFLIPLSKVSIGDQLRLFLILVESIANVALELGLEYNTQLKITLIGQQLLNVDPNGELGKFVARLIVGYRF